MPHFDLLKDEISFPPAHFADIDGLLAVGGDMSVERMLLAYNSGIYYWHFPLKHIKWWSPDPRTVVILDTYDFPDNRLNVLRDRFYTTHNKAFGKTLRLCQNVYNKKDKMTNEWLSERAFRTFLELHDLGYARAFETWKNNKLVGGVFGIAIGKLFFVEYQFAILDHADELAILSMIKYLKEKNFRLIDMHKPTAFYEGIAYNELSRIEYIDICKSNAEYHRDKMKTI